MDSIAIGALVPLSPPGWVDAGRHLLAGLELGVRDVNAAGGIEGRPLELLVHDTAADPERAAAAVDESVRRGAAAVAGEYHSVAARAAAARADAVGLPFLCSSAVLDALTDAPAERVARLPPPQSRGWGMFAHFLAGAGHRRIAVAAEPSVYWTAGIGVLRERFADVHVLAPDAVRAELAGTRATALLLLVGNPEPAVSIVRAIRGDARLTDVTIGAPAGQPELPGWLAALGEDGAGIPFLRYLPDRLTALGARVDAALRERLAGAPSFVAFEGYDSVVVLADMLRSGRWDAVSVQGTRGRIAFTRTPGTGVWQWAQAPIQIADRDPEAPERFRIHPAPGWEERARGTGDDP